MPNGDSTTPAPNWYSGGPADYAPLGMTSTYTGPPPPAAPASTPPPAPPQPPNRVAVGPYGQPTAYLPRPEGMPDNAYNFLMMTPYYESGWQNIRNYAYNDDPSKGPIRTASGLWQITDTNWRNYAPKLDIRDAHDPSKPARTAMDAQPVDQLRVAYEVWKEQGEQAWTVYNPRLNHAVQTGMRARPGSPEEMARFGGGAAAGVPASYKTGGGAAPMDGAATDPNYLKLLASLTGGGGGSAIDGAATPASYRSGMWPPVPPGAAGTTPPGAAPTQPPAWLSKAVGPNAAAAIGSAPRGPVGQGGTGFLGGLTSFLTNPLTQAAAQGYFTAVAAPRGTSPFGRVGLGGLAAMGTLADQERQAQITDPYLMQQMSLQGQEAAARAQLYRKAAMAAPAGSIDRLQTMAKIEADLGAKATTDQERAHYAYNTMLMQNLAEGARAGVYGAEDVNTFLEKFNEAKAQQDIAHAMLYRGQYYTGEAVRPLVTEMLGGGGAGTSRPAPTGASGTPPAEGTIPGLRPGDTLPAAMQKEIAQLPPGFSPDFTPGRQNIRPKPGATDQWQYKVGGQWWEIGPDGLPTVVT